MTTCPDNNLELKMKQRQNAIRRKKERNPLFIADSMETSQPHHVLRQMDGTEIVQIAGAMLYGYSNQDQLRRNFYKVPVILNFNYNTQVTTSLCLFCCFYGYSAKLREQIVYSHSLLITQNNPGGNKIRWCSLERTWIWSQPRLAIDFCPPDCPPVVFSRMVNAARTPYKLTASLQGTLPLRCSFCLFWTADYSNLLAHKCHSSSSQIVRSIGCNRRAVPITLDTEESYEEPNFMLVCPHCMLFFFHTLCLQAHEPFCGVFHYSRISPEKTLEPLHRHSAINEPSSLLVKGTPFRKLRCGCSHCLKHLCPQGSWLGVSFLAVRQITLARWIYMTVSVYLRANFLKGCLKQFATLRWSAKALKRRGTLTREILEFL